MIFTFSSLVSEQNPLVILGLLAGIFDKAQVCTQWKYKCTEILATAEIIKMSVVYNLYVNEWFGIFIGAFNFSCLHHIKCAVFHAWINFTLKRKISCL